MEFQRKLRNFLSLLDEAEADMKYFADLTRSHQSQIEIIVKVWQQSLFQASPQRKLYFFYAVHELLNQTYSSDNSFVKAFGDVLRQSVKHFCQRVNIVESIDLLDSTLKMWEQSKIYSGSFISELQKILEERKEVLKKGKQGEGVDEQLVQFIQTIKQSGTLATVYFHFEKNEIRERRQNVRLTLQIMQAMNKTEKAFELTALQRNLAELRKGLDLQASTMQEIGELLEELGEKAKYVEESMERVRRQK